WARRPSATPRHGRGGPCRRGVHRRAGGGGGRAGAPPRRTGGRFARLGRLPPPSRGRADRARARRRVEPHAMTALHTIAVTVNGTRCERAVEARLLLSDFLRHALGLTGTH